MSFKCSNFETCDSKCSHKIEHVHNSCCDVLCTREGYQDAICVNIIYFTEYANR